MKLFDRLPVDAPLNRFPLVSYVKGDDVYHGGDHLMHATAEPLLTKEECDAIIAESEEWAEREGGWTSKRHFNHPTTDIPLAELPRTREFLNTDALPSRIYPMLGHAFENSLPNWRALRVADAFVVKYNATGGQTSLSPHRDGSVLSFNIALNDRGEYEGGGHVVRADGRGAADRPRTRAPTRAACSTAATRSRAACGTSSSASCCSRTTRTGRCAS